MIEYYKNRAEEYENIYHKPERQIYIEEYKEYLVSIFREKELLELACGTGYWTEPISYSTKKIKATDINEEVINVAKRKRYSENCEIEFSVMDYKNCTEYEHYNALFAGFLVSHLSRNEIQEFIKMLIQNTKKNTKIVIMDNCFIEGESKCISRTDIDGNTYQIRKLNDGSTYEIMKNFFSKDELENMISNYHCFYQYKSNKYYWSLEINT